MNTINYQPLPIFRDGDLDHEAMHAQYKQYIQQSIYKPKLEAAKAVLTAPLRVLVGRAAAVRMRLQELQIMTVLVNAARLMRHPILATTKYYVID